MAEAGASAGVWLALSQPGGPCQELTAAGYQLQPRGSRGVASSEPVAPTELAVAFQETSACSCFLSGTKLCSAPQPPEGTQQGSVPAWMDPRLC